MSRPEFFQRLNQDPTNPLPSEQLKMLPSSSDIRGPAAIPVPLEPSGFFQPQGMGAPGPGPGLGTVIPPGAQLVTPQHIADTMLQHYREEYGKLQEMPTADKFQLIRDALAKRIQALTGISGESPVPGMPNLKLGIIGYQPGAGKAYSELQAQQAIEREGLKAAQESAMRRAELAPAGATPQEIRAAGLPATAAPFPQPPAVDSLLSTIRNAADKHGTVYIRWSSGPSFDMQPGARSVDKVSGALHSGLSARPITSDMSDGQILNALKEYGFLRMNRQSVRPTVYFGEQVGLDSDGYPLIQPRGIAASVPESIVHALDSGLAERTNSTEQLADINNRILKTTDPVGKEILQRRMDQLKAALQSSAPFPQYAERYPPVSPFATFQEKEKYPGQFYLGRSSTPETQAFYAERNRVMKDMEQNGYSPFFDVGARYHVDPTYYPPPSENLGEGYMPKTEKTANEWRQRVQTDDARDRLQEAYDKGVAFGGHDRWYQMGQLEKSFIDELGPELGRQRFFEWTQAMASTTAGASPEMNLISAQYGRYLRSRGEAIPLDMYTDPLGNLAGSGKPASYAMPAPTRGLYLGGNMAEFQKVLNEGQGLGWRMPKRTSFNYNFLGRTDMATIDEQMASLMTPELQEGKVFDRKLGQWGDIDKDTGVFKPGKMKAVSAPPKGSYFAYDELVREMARKNGVSPDEFQAIVWGGKKQSAKGAKYVGKSMMEIVNEAIERTSRLTGMSPAEVLRRGIIRGEVPIYGVLGAAGAGAAMEAGIGQRRNER